MKKIIIGILISSVILYGVYGVYKKITNNKLLVKSEVPTTSNYKSNTPVTAYQALNLLKKGNKIFVDDKSQSNNVDSKRRQELKNGQHPYATIVSCSDSRVTPTLIFNAGLGDIFDVRLAGNIVNCLALGSIEYAVEHLHSPLIVVMGHEKCGAVTAAYDNVVNGQKEHGYIENLVDEIKPSITKNGTIDDAIRKNVKNVANKIEKDPIIAQAIKNGNLKIVTAYYYLNGTVKFDS